MFTLKIGERFRFWRSYVGGSLCICFRGFLYGGGVHHQNHVFLHFFTPVIKFHPFCYRLFPIFSDYFRFQFCSKKQKKTKNVLIFKVSLELRFIFEFWVSYPDNLWFLPNFFGKLFHFMWTIFDFQFLPHSFFLPNSQKKFEKHTVF